ncbi:MAG: PAS domain S-box protein [Chloroflexi bacterium]|nr:PAS domain S-box protein [Chloroflexota bacterium]
MATDPHEEKLELRRQLERANRTNSERALIVEMARELSGSLDLGDIGGVVARAAASLTGAGLCSLWVVGREGKLQPVARTEGSAGELPPLSSRLPLIEQAVSANKVIRWGDHSAVLPLRFGDAALAALELVKCPFPQHLDEQIATLQHVLPFAALSLKNALAAAQLREAIVIIEQKNLLLEEQNEELNAQNEEIQAQSEEIQSQNAELAERQDELEAKNAETQQANRELERLVEVSQHQEARLRTIIDASADGIMVVDGKQTVVSINPTLEAMLGFSEGELIGHTCKYRLGAHQASGDLVCDSVCPFLFPVGGSPKSVDATVTTRDGRQVWVNVAYGPIYDAQGRVTAVVHSIRDISARKELEQLKDEFLSMVAHDLKTPLTSIKGYAQLLHRRALKNESRSDELQSLETIDSQSKRMLNMINRLLEITRIQMGRLELRLEPTDLRQLAERIVEQAQVTTERHKLLFQAEAKDVVGIWDSTYVEEVLGNLVDNAIKYSPQGGKIELKLQSVGGEACVSVRDQGPGIAKADQSRLFERYYRTARARQGAQGLGLGLYICRGLVEAHGGRIWVDSQEGMGSTFHFSLPLKTDASVIPLAPAEF